MDYNIFNDKTFRTFYTEELKLIGTIFNEKGYEIRIFGDAVRDILNHSAPPVNICLLTTASLDDCEDVLTKKHIEIKCKVQHTNTITAYINKANFDIKSLCSHTITESNATWKAYACKCDFTINSIYLDLKGNVVDYFGGVNDISSKKIVFIGNSSERIAEDPIRILKYFTLFGRFVDDPNLHDEATLKAIEENAQRLSKIPGKRIRTEMNRIFLGKNEEANMKTMIKLNITPHIGMGSPEDLDLKSFEKLCSLKNKYTFNAIAYIAALFDSEEKMKIYYDRVKLTEHEFRLGCYLLHHKFANFNDIGESPITHFQRFIIFSNMPKSVAREFVNNLLQFHDLADVLEAFHSWKIPDFPITKEQLEDKGVEREKIEKTIHKLKEIWFESDFKINARNLIKKIEQITMKFDQEKSPPAEHLTLPEHLNALMEHPKTLQKLLKNNSIKDEKTRLVCEEIAKSYSDLIWSDLKNGIALDSVKNENAALKYELHQLESRNADLNEKNVHLMRELRDLKDNPEEEAAKWKDKFYDSKTKLVLRCEIEKFKKVVNKSNEFKFDQTKIDAKIDQYEKSQEAWRQRMSFILNSSPDKEAVKLRIQLILWWIKYPEEIKIDSNEESNLKREEIRKSISIDTLKLIEVYQKLLNEPNMIVKGFKKAILLGPQASDTCNWLIHVFEIAANRVAHIFRIISVEVHTTKFLNDEERPDNCKLFAGTIHDSIAKLLLTNSLPLPQQDEEN